MIEATVSTCTLAITFITESTDHRDKYTYGPFQVWMEDGIAVGVDGKGIAHWSNL